MTLFSNPQDIEANKTKIDPIVNSKALTYSKVKTQLDIKIKMIAIQSLKLIFSLKINNAIKEFATISKLFNKAVF